MDMDTCASDGTVTPSTTVPFTEEAVKEYLDKCIERWRLAKCTELQEFQMKAHYVDAYQSVRVSIFGELLPKERE